MTSECNGCILYVNIQQVCVEEGELVPVDSLEIFRPLTVSDAQPLEGCVLSIRLNQYFH